MNTKSNVAASSGSLDRLVRQILCAYWSQRKNYYLAIPEGERDETMVNQLAVAELCLDHAQRGSSALRVHLRAAWRDTKTQLGRFRKMTRYLFLPNDQAHRLRPEKGRK